MAVNVQDTALALEKMIRESAEYNQLKEEYARVFEEEATKNLFNNFRNIQLQLQEKQMTGQPISEEEVQEAQKVVAIVQQNPTIVKLMEAEQRMSSLIAEVNKIVMRPLEEMYSTQMN
ncbi:YlbF family regulator [Caldibacillus lycopersici]|uniref:UPF0342 protein OEV98_02995 n=1 Tax=Perspicuibacillus lycopersici TaxID=1325689 RepID=A0AAE3IQ53_9BACI|nr:YlbF family regulator [Perspicuibacillus lycopersici]MCU9612530.1 YlbF family regulator [Perspicuibacillus lycopersici]